MQKIVKLKISGMHCPSCEKLVGMKLEKLPEVTSFKVSAEKGQAEIETDSSLQSDQIVSKIKEAGYDAEIIEEENKDE